MYIVFLRSDFSCHRIFTKFLLNQSCLVSPLEGAGSEFGDLQHHQLLRRGWRLAEGRRSSGGVPGPARAVTFVGWARYGSKICRCNVWKTLENCPALGGAFLKPYFTYGSLLRLFGHSSRCSFFEPSNFTGMVQIGSKIYHLLGTTFDRGICLSHHPFHHSTIELAQWQTYDIDS